MKLITSQIFKNMKNDYRWFGALPESPLNQAKYLKKGDDPKPSLQITPVKVEIENVTVMNNQK